MKFGDKLKEIRKAKSITQLELSSLTDIPRSSLAQYETNLYEPDITKIKKIAKALKVDFNSLLEDNKENNIIQHFVPLVGKASCGIPQEYDLNGYEPFPIDSKLYQKGMYAVEAEGDSMSPKINEGDIVYCCPENVCEIKNNDIVHYRLNDESGIKRFKINEDQTIISLVPINTAYDVITVKWEDGVDLKLAKVVGSVDLDY